MFFLHCTSIALFNVYLKSELESKSRLPIPEFSESHCISEIIKWVCFHGTVSVSHAHWIVYSDKLSLNVVFSFLSFTILTVYFYSRSGIFKKKKTFVLNFWLLPSFQTAWIYIIMEAKRSCQLTTSLCLLVNLLF